MTLPEVSLHLIDPQALLACLRHVKTRLVVQRYQQRIAYIGLTARGELFYEGRLAHVRARTGLVLLKFCVDRRRGLVRIVDGTLWQGFADEMIDLAQQIGLNVQRG